MTSESASELLDESNWSRSTTKNCVNSSEIVRPTVVAMQTSRCSTSGGNYSRLNCIDPVAIECLTVILSVAVVACSLNEQFRATDHEAEDC